MKRILNLGVLSLCILLPVVYLGDYLSIRYRVAHAGGSSPFGIVTLQRSYEIPHKDGRAEFVFDDPVSHVCVHSLFPHFGYGPCWYLNREEKKPVQMSILWPPAPQRKR